MLSQNVLRLNFLAIMVNHSLKHIRGTTIQTYEGPQGPRTMLLKSGTVPKIRDVEVYEVLPIEQLPSQRGFLGDREAACLYLNEGSCLPLSHWGKLLASISLGGAASYLIGGSCLPLSLIGGSCFPLLS